MRLGLGVLLLLLATACGGHFQVPKERYRAEVKTLGVVPILVDESSTVAHPQRAELLQLLQRQSAGKHRRLAEMLQETEGYFDVRTVDGDPGRLFRDLVADRSIDGEGSERHRRYRFRDAAVRRLAEREVVDALLLVVLNGVERREKRRDRTLLNYLETDYNMILASAAVVRPSGEVVWEYAGGAKPFLHLQYPAFDEAHYNRSDRVQVKFISLAGLERALTEAEGSWLRPSSFPVRYRTLFEDLVDSLDPGLLNPFAPSAEDRPAAQ